MTRRFSDELGATETDACGQDKGSGAPPPSGQQKGKSASKGKTKKKGLAKGCGGGSLRPAASHGQPSDGGSAASTDVAGPPTEVPSPTDMDGAVAAAALEAAGAFGDGDQEGADLLGQQQSDTGMDDEDDEAAADDR